MKRFPFLVTVLLLGYAFLYIPILALIGYSFNDSLLASHWGGMSLRWYRELFNNGLIQDAFWLSVRIALISATFATLLGTFAGLALARVRKFRGRRLFSGMLAAPLVMPEVITGLSLHVNGIAAERDRLDFTIPVSYSQYHE